MYVCAQCFGMYSTGASMSTEDNYLYGDRYKKLLNNDPLPSYSTKYMPIHTYVFILKVTVINNVGLGRQGSEFMKYICHYIFSPAYTQYTVIKTLKIHFTFTFYRIPVYY